VVCWIHACIILNNLLLEGEYTYENFEHDSNMVTNLNGDDLDTLVTNDTRNKANKEVIKMEVLQFHGDINT
jgi:hypothetical protein